MFEGDVRHSSENATTGVLNKSESPLAPEFSFKF
jgi:hypothetical protein